VSDQNPAERPFGLRILGSGSESIGAQRVRVQGLLTLVLVGANVVGAAVVAGLNVGIIPGRRLIDTDQRAVVLVLAPAYIAAAVVVGAVWGTRRELPRLRWAVEDRDPDASEQLAAFAAPRRLLLVQAVLWLVALVLFTGLALPGGARVVARTALTVALGGTVTCTYAYLLSELALRPVAARALAVSAPAAPRAGLGTRSALVWLVGTAVPVVGLMLVGGAALLDGDPDGTAVAQTTLALGGLTLAVSAFLLWLATRSITDPLQSLRAGIERIEEGDLGSRTVVYDATEIGRVQAAFNRMAAGLEEREVLRDLFSRHVGGVVADEALRRGAELGGELSEATALFVDVVASTTLGERLPPSEVVRLLNRFFGQVVDAVTEQGGWVNKFEGDAALCVFGPPHGQGDHADAALRAARALRERLDALAAEAPIEAAIGVASGTVIAGNVGAEERYEYTVIGDTVNAAARLSELAKDHPARLLADGAAVAAASDAERRRWRHLDDVVLRGRSRPTALHTLRRPGAG
jgi:adenylate cyclase